MITRITLFLLGFLAVQSVEAKVRVVGDGKDRAWAIARVWTGSGINYKDTAVIYRVIKTGAVKPVEHINFNKIRPNTISMEMPDERIAEIRRQKTVNRTNTARQDTGTTSATKLQLQKQYRQSFETRSRDIGFTSWFTLTSPQATSRFIAPRFWSFEKVKSILVFVLELIALALIILGCWFFYAFIKGKGDFLQAQIDALKQDVRQIKMANVHMSGLQEFIRTLPQKVAWKQSRITFRVSRLKPRLQYFKQILPRASLLHLRLHMPRWRTVSIAPRISAYAEAIRPYIPSLPRFHSIRLSPEAKAETRRLKEFSDSCITCLGRPLASQQKLHVKTKFNPAKRTVSFRVFGVGNGSFPNLREHAANVDQAEQVLLANDFARDFEALPHREVYSLWPRKRGVEFKFVRRR